MIKILLTVMILIALPTAVGTIFLPLQKKGGRIVFSWIFGMITLWGGFQLLCVPMILRNQRFLRIVWANRILCLCLLLLAAALAVFRQKAGGMKTEAVTEAEAPREVGDLKKADATKEAKEQGTVLEKRVTVFLWILFFALFLLQMVCSVFLAYEEGDDSFYVAITASCRDDSVPYSIEPYTGQTTILDVRHAFAPFPVWVALFARSAGVSGAAASHVGMPLLILPMAYGLLFLIGKKLLKGEGGKGWQLPLFLSAAALLVIFGGYSTYSPENFLLVRATQGKAVLANVIIPSLFYLLLLWMEKLEKKEPTPVSCFLLTAIVMVAGCLCSTMGGMLLPMIYGIAGLCGVVAYKRWKHLIGMGCVLLVPFGFAILYLIN